MRGLMRLDRPIGTWLLLLPCWWGVALDGTDARHLGMMALFAAGAVVMRGAGCVVNDLYDRDLDRQVERTRDRPLASGAVSVPQALTLLGVLLLTGLCVLLQFNRATVLTGAASLLLVATYPLMKRVTWWPQLFLGFTFNCGALLAGTATVGQVDTAHALLYAGGIFWTLGYDTIYAHQDIADDAQIGVRSTARLFGSRSRSWVASFYAAALAILIWSGYMAHLHLVFYAGLMIAGLFALRLVARWHPDAQADCLRRFRANRDFGLIVLAAIVAGRWFIA